LPAGDETRAPFAEHGITTTLRAGQEISMAAFEASPLKVDNIFG
jgi:hypothetical protein